VSNVPSNSIAGGGFMHFSKDLTSGSFPQEIIVFQKKGKKEKKCFHNDSKGQIRL